MTTFIALLRGVNVGKARRFPMAELRALLSGLGYKGVATLLNSGNAVFRAPTGTPAKHATDIAAAIATQLKVQIPVIVKSASELARIISENPIKAEAKEQPRLLVAFVQSTMSAAGAVRDRQECRVPVLRQGHAAKQGRGSSSGQHGQVGHDEKLGDRRQAAGARE